MIPVHNSIPIPDPINKALIDRGGFRASMSDRREVVSDEDGSPRI